MREIVKEYDNDNQQIDGRNNNCLKVVYYI